MIKCCFRVKQDNVIEPGDREEIRWSWVASQGGDAEPRLEG